jgi:hypothetical protein
MRWIAFASITAAAGVVRSQGAAQAAESHEEEQLRRQQEGAGDSVDDHIPRASVADQAYDGGDDAAGAHDAHHRQDKERLAEGWVPRRDICPVRDRDQEEHQSDPDSGLAVPSRSERPHKDQERE